MFRFLLLLIFFALFSQAKDTSFNNAFNISTHEKNYFLPLSYTFKGKYPDEKRAEIKFQLSIKKLLFENLFSLNENYYFAYTQKAWWQAYKDSAPFNELNFKPEFFVNIPLNLASALKNIRVSLMHESNGKANENFESRSWNRLYFAFLFQQKDLSIEPRFWYRLPEDKDDNKDILHYIGNFELSLRYIKKDFFSELVLKNNLNFKDNKLGLELNTGFDLFDNGVFYYLQYYYGYAQSLTNYNRLSNKLSFGFLIAY